jgi:hypothetical protein
MLHSKANPLGAVNGATIAGLEAQLAGVPADASHLVISIGGNDVLENSDLLSLAVTSSGAALQAFADRLTAFERAYRRAINTAMALERHTAVCTVYNGALELDQVAVARVGLAVFNDAILRTAIDLRVDAVELRHICTDRADYVNGIEPSAAGGLKIARAVAHLVGAVRCRATPARIWSQT